MYILFGIHNNRNSNYYIFNMKDEKTIREQAIEYQEKRERQLNQLADDITTLFYDYGLTHDEFNVVFEMVTANFDITEIFNDDDDEEEPI